jgi:hypothetical protein
MHFARYRVGKISLVTAHTIGPHVMANAEMNRHAKTIMA